MPPRHSLVWLNADGWDVVQAGTLQEAVPVRDALARWRSAGWPLVVRRKEPDQLAACIAIGIPLPPQMDTALKVRIEAVVEPQHIDRVAPPLLLADALHSVLPQWRAALLALQMDAMDALPPFRVFGSLAWQSITGMTYLRSTSDIDLLFSPESRQELSRAIGLLARHASTLPLDGEIVFPSGAAVAWKEWRDVTEAQATTGAGPSRVLAKQLDGVTLTECSTLLASFDAAARDR
jgi:phosphoribosyl-dephospho-CoA transferase